MDKLNDVPARVIAEVVTSNVGRELSSLRLLGLSAQPNSSNVKIIKTLAEAFRELEQRAEAAEAQLAELKKQKPIGVVYHTERYGFHVGWSDSARMDAGMELFARASPTAVPVKLSRIIQTGYTHDEITAMCNVRNDDVAAIRAAGYEVEE